MQNSYMGRIVVKVVADGCSIGLENAQITIFDASGKRISSSISAHDGFSPTIDIFSSEKIGDKRSVTIKVSLIDFDTLTLSPISVRSGYTYFLSAPLKRI